METNYYSRKMCEKLADELVSVETEIAKQSVLLESIKKLIAERKTEIIKGLIWGEKLHFPSKTYMVVDVTLAVPEMSRFGFIVQGILATDPASVEKSDLKLSAAESKLFAEYKEAYENYYDLLDIVEFEKMQKVAVKMRGLKNKLNLILFKNWSFRFDDASSERFFVDTGVRLHLEAGYCPLIETLIRR